MFAFIRRFGLPSLLLLIITTAFTVILASGSGMTHIQESYQISMASQQNPMQGFALANIAISTPDQERMINWYTDILGFRLVEQSEGVGGIKLALIEKDGIQMDLIQPPALQPLPEPQDPPMHLETPGIRNLVFWVDNLEAADAHLKSKNVSLLFESLYVEGIRTIISAFRDPDGNLVALWQKRNNEY